MFSVEFFSHLLLPHLRSYFLLQPSLHSIYKFLMFVFYFINRLLVILKSPFVGYSQSLLTTKTHTGKSKARKTKHTFTLIRSLCAATGIHNVIIVLDDGIFASMFILIVLYTKTENPFWSVFHYLTWKLTDVRTLQKKKQKKNKAENRQKLLNI